MLPSAIVPTANYSYYSNFFQAFIPISFNRFLAYKKPLFGGRNTASRKIDFFENHLRTGYTC